MTTIPVTVEGESYPIWISMDLLPALGERLAEAGLANVAVVTHPSLARRFGPRVQPGLAAAGVKARWITVPEGEAAKSLAGVQHLYGAFAKAGLDRHSAVVALGGGVVGDLAGFAAATYLRGVPLVQAPTTLLAQVDSAIGGKTGVNLIQGKNLVGAFHQPRFVLVDLAVLESLPKRELSAGLAEVVKAAAIKDPKLFTALERSAEEIARGTVDALSWVVPPAIRVKAAVVSADPREKGVRMILNLGHTIGHGLEAAGGFNRLLHGEAVAVGLVAAARIARSIGLLEDQIDQRLEALLPRLGLPVRCPPLRLTAILAAMGHDKKRAGKTLQFVLPVRVGSVAMFDNIPTGLVKQVLIELGAKQG